MPKLKMPALNKKVLLIAAAVVVIAGLAVGLFVYLKNQKPPDKIGPEIQVTNPTSEEWFASSEESILLGGFVVDPSGVKSLSWETGNGKSGAASLEGDSWTTEAVSLAKGDNKITLAALDKKNNKSEVVLNVVYNPTVSFYDLTLSQDYLYKGDSAATITIRAGVDTSSSTAIGEVALYKISGDKKDKLTPLVDSGVVSDGDDIPGDTIYSGVHYFSATSADPILLRVGARLEKTDDVFYSGVIKIAVLEQPTEAQLSKVLSLNKEIDARFEELKKGGDAKKAAAKLVEELSKKEEIAVAGVSDDGYGVWWKYKETGILAGLLNNPDGTRAVPSDEVRKEQAREAQRQSEAGSVAGISDVVSSTVNFGVSKTYAQTKGPEVKSTKALYLGPYLHQFGDTDDYHKAWKTIKDSKCPECQTVEQKDQEVTVEDFKGLNKYGLVVISSHGDTWFNGKFAANCVGNTVCPPALKNGNGYVITWTDQQVTQADLRKYVPDLTRYRLAIDAHDNTLAIMPPFITAYNGTFPNSLVYVGTCRSTHNFTMAAAYLSKGAKSYFGFSEYVNSGYAGDVAGEMIKSFLDKGKTSGEAFNDAVAAKGASDGGNPAAFFNLLGNRSLVMGGKNLQNLSFEDGLVGWQADGDARVIARLASLVPQEGKKMAIISTGLGSVSDSISTLSQVICSKEGKATLTFKYNFVSEEPMEYVGSKYDDYFVVTVDINGKKATVVEKLINNASWTPIGGINFAGGDSTTFMTGWATQSFDLGEIKKDDKVQIEFRVGDKGDSIYDSAALIDDVALTVN
ncbi:MAG: hypothetical protein A3F35_03490 [Candidatus Woykebacteria bacterium RIFCSPHIGHO2_12_FULL_45_10]|uniref:Uncharacterized protein n=1 Tax=Candidatus Woykebacteria bacterium RIFCSPHIGHO2_12_FULL_45_10 TaxID=1802603 RepID=A0A1G1WRX0_9BACT|nr:MAG: hypothetical protein A3F35_03490 [Candidatus Woykebacteria bacterium RIFCSPHIGHO2_12_FULL_45_10]